MTKQDKATLEKILKDLVEAKDVIQYIKDEEEAKYDNLSEKAQESEKGEKLSDKIDTLDDAIDKIEETFACIQEALEN